MIKFIHAADIHLDSPLIGLENYEGAPVEKIRGAARKALSELVDLAAEEEASFVVIAGDMYDGDWKDYNTGLFLLNTLSKLASNGINVFIAKGNHDAESKITKNLKPPEGIKIFSSKKPETFYLNLKNFNIAIHGQSFSSPAVKENLASNYPQAEKGMFNVGILHTSVNGRAGHENYAPCSIDDLKSKGYNYWALGHIHKREVLSENPLIVFPGNIQGRHIKETGFKGCMVVSIDDDYNVSAEFKSLCSIVWSYCETDVTGAESPEEVVEKVNISVKNELSKNKGMFTAARISIKGACRAHNALLSDPEKWKNEIRLEAANSCKSSVWLEKINIKTSVKADMEELKKRKDAVGDLMRYIDSLNGEQSQEIKDMLSGISSDLKDKLPRELKNNNFFDNGENILEITNEARQILLSRLLSSTTAD
ncbi:MAG: DNA repair exonuclease [Candidatus Acidulodesulfobacterium acidiphilum]|uniref:DNA repair exonuclease n=1 Tax=Candidatus Acidulodesulfobacterium acidiphilum TaxID=2597224 RepID=A0A520XH65_9DELT|nr:MAG: DNA repair exonuclease [Candidatus Acidulodesulfobacterium acidiphilum]